MDAKIKEMYEHLDDFGITYYQFNMWVTKGTANPVCQFGFKTDWASKKETEYKFDTFSELYDFVMNYTGKHWTCTGAYI